MAERRCWLSIVVGRAHTHWAWFRHHQLAETWTTELLADGHLTVESVFGLPVKMLPDQVREELQKRASEEEEDSEPVVYVASDDNVQLEMWTLRLPRAKVVTVPDLLLKGSNRNIELCRALCLRAAASKWGWPVLVIDASTNITFSACDDVGEYTGGAMLPGIGSMLRLVNSQGVRNPTELPDSLPARWATSTEELVHSGVIHTVLAGIAAYTSEYSKKQDQCKVVFTGEDGLVLWQWFREQFKPIASDLGNRCLQNPHLAHLGVRWKYIQDTCLEAADGAPGFIGHAVSKRFGGKYYRGVVKEYLPPLDEDAERGEAFWGIEYQDGDVEEVDKHELRELLANAKQQGEKRSRSAAETKDGERRAKRNTSQEVSVVDDDSA